MRIYRKKHAGTAGTAGGESSKEGGSGCCVLEKSIYIDAVAFHCTGNAIIYLIIVYYNNAVI